MPRRRDESWTAFADRHRMQLYDRSHGLLRGAVKAFDLGRVNAIECPVGIEFDCISTIWRPTTLVWADGDFGEWCRRSEQASIAEASAREVAKVVPTRSEAERARALPHLAAWNPVVCDVPEISARLHCLSGSPYVRDICEPQMLLTLPRCLCLAVLGETLSVYFPLESDPEIAFLGFQQIVNARVTQIPG